jgi:hypothetical protein
MNIVEFCKDNFVNEVVKFENGVYVFKIDVDDLINDLNESVKFEYNCVKNDNVSVSVLDEEVVEFVFVKDIEKLSKYEINFLKEFVG